MTYCILLRSLSLWEPRHPLLKKIQEVLVHWANQCLIPERTRRRLNGFGHDPSAARPHELSELQSESFTDSFNRQVIGKSAAPVIQLFWVFVTGDSKLFDLV
eukprot:gene3940-7876_t